MRKLDEPRIIKTRLGPVTATHDFFEIFISERPGSEHVQSVRKLAVEVGGELVPIDDGAEHETVTSRGDELNSLGLNYSNIIKLHEGKMQKVRTDRDEAARQEQERVEAEIAAAEAQLAELKRRKRG